MRLRPPGLSISAITQGGKMSLIPNIGPGTRAAYVVSGLALVGLALWAPFLSRTLALIVGALGAVGVVEGIIGF